MLMIGNDSTLRQSRTKAPAPMRGAVASSLRCSALLRWKLLRTWQLFLCNVWDTGMLEHVESGCMMPLGQGVRGRSLCPPVLAWLGKKHQPVKKKEQRVV